MKSHSIVSIAFLFVTSYYVDAFTLNRIHPTSTIIQNSQQQQSKTQLQSEKKKGFFSNFFDELDSFVDDATNRRLGNGAAFYGKRKSSFYGEEDFMKKLDNEVPDPLEDYQGPKKAGYFTWMMDEETGQMKPVTRMKKQNIERNPNYWDKVYKSDKE
jgi:hypothetical protein